RENSSSRFLIAGETLYKVDPALAEETLTTVLHDKDNLGGRAWALAVLLKLAPDAHGTVPALSKMVHDPDARLRVQARRVLWHMKEPAEPLVAALCAEACADNSAVGVQAIEALGEMGSAA